MANEVSGAYAAAPRFREALDQLLPEIRGLPQSEFLKLNLKIEAIVTTVLGAWPRIRELRPNLLEVPDFDPTVLDRLELYAMALGHAQTVYRTAMERPPPPIALAERAIQVRQLLLCEVNTLIARGLIAPRAVAGLQGVNGYKTTAFDLFALCNWLKKSWDKVSSKTTLTLEGLDEAENLADALLTTVGKREQHPEIPAVVVRDRLAAFTLLVNAYHEVRTTILFVRKKQGDGDAIAPSLYVRRRRRKTKSRRSDPLPVTPESGNSTIENTLNSSERIDTGTFGSNGNAPKTSEPIGTG